MPPYRFMLPLHCMIHCSTSPLFAHWNFRINGSNILIVGSGSAGFWWNTFGLLMLTVTFLSLPWSLQNMEVKFPTFFLHLHQKFCLWPLFEVRLWVFFFSNNLAESESICIAEANDTSLNSAGLDSHQRKSDMSWPALAFQKCLQNHRERWGTAE